MFIPFAALQRDRHTRALARARTFLHLPLSGPTPFALTLVIALLAPLAHILSVRFLARQRTRLLARLLPRRPRRVRVRRHVACSPATVRTQLLAGIARLKALPGYVSSEGTTYLAPAVRGAAISAWSSSRHGPGLVVARCD